jgi:cell division protein ZapB
MNEELLGLEGKVAQVIALCDSLRAENHRLHDRIGALEDEKQALAERMTAARTRIESLMDHLPPE